MTQLSELLDEAVGTPSVRFSSRDVQRRSRQLRFRRRFRRALAGGIVVAVSVGVVVTVTNLVTNGRSGRLRAPTRHENGVFASPTGSVLVFEDGSSGLVLVDLDRRIAVRRQVPSLGQPPNQVLSAGKALIVGSPTVYAEPFDAAPAIDLGPAKITIPAAESGNVWLIGYGAGPTFTAREVNVDGTVLHQAAGLNIGYPTVGIPGGIAAEGPTGIVLWNAQTGTTTRLGSASASVEDVHNNVLAWCEKQCNTMHLTQIGGRDLTVAPPPPEPVFDAGDARFSPDGRYLAAIAVDNDLPIGAANSTGEIVLIDTHTGATKIITSKTLQRTVSLAWSADSKHLFYSPFAYGTATHITIGEYSLVDGSSQTATLPFWGHLLVTANRNQIAPLLAAPTVSRGACTLPPLNGNNGPCAFSF
jgi:hypothetical protein